jgi:hypothetical protein
MNAVTPVEKVVTIEAKPRLAATEPVSIAKGDNVAHVATEAEPIAPDPGRPLRRDQFSLWFWVACAVILVVYHFQDLFHWLAR